MKRKCLMAFFILVTAQFVAVSGAHAASSYDDTIEPGVLVIEQEGTHDITTSWRAILGSKPAAVMLSDCLDTQESGSGYGWGASQTSYPAYGNVKQVRVWCTASTSPAYFIDTEVGVPSLHVPDAWQCTIYYYSGNYGVDCASSRWSRQIAHRESPYNFEQLNPVFINHPVAYPTGYEGIVATEDAPGVKYVAIGDSFSSGEGNAPYMSDTDVDNYNTCHRSRSAYPRILAAEPALGLNLTSFRACSGATIDHIINESNLENNELPQAAWITPDTGLVTITIGGNDVGFGNVMSECVRRHEKAPSLTQDETDQQKCSEALAASRSALESSAFEDELTDVYEGITSLGNENTKFIVVGYPKMFPDFASISGTCTWGSGTFGLTSGRAISESEINAINDMTADLNDLADSAVSSLNNPQIRFEDPSAMFASYELCALNTAKFHFVDEVIDPVNQRGSFHPNESGQFAYFVTVLSRLLNWNQ